MMKRVRGFRELLQDSIFLALPIRVGANSNPPLGVPSRKQGRGQSVILRYLQVPAIPKTVKQCSRVLVLNTRGYRRAAGTP